MTTLITAAKETSGEYNKIICFFINWVDNVNWPP